MSRTIRATDSFVCTPFPLHPPRLRAGWWSSILPRPLRHSHALSPFPVTRLSRILLASLALLVLGRLGVEVYDWAAYRQERERVRELRARLGDAGAEVVRSHARADTVHAAFLKEDGALEREGRLVDAYRERALGGGPPDAYAAYRGALERYNHHVAGRNARVRELRAARVRLREAQAHYHALADSIRGVARVLGDPYYPIPLPAEAAAERGALKLDP